MKTRHFAAFAATAALVFAGLVAAPLSAQASNLIVTSSADSGPGSLRDVVASSAAGETVAFDPSVTVIYLQSQIDIPHSLIIDGPGSGLLTISRVDDGNFNQLNISPTVANTDVTISGLTLDGGKNSFGVAIVDSYGPTNIQPRDLTLDDVTIQKQSYSGGSAVYGYQQLGDVTITNSTFSGNFANQAGGAVRLDGFHNLTVTGSTFTDNADDADGGAIAIFNQSGAFAISSSTFTGNLSNNNDGGAIWISDVSADSSISNSTFALNTAVNGSGGAVRVDSTHARFDVSQSSFLHNTALNNGGALGVGTVELPVVSGASTGLHITNSTFGRNTLTTNTIGGSSIAVNVVHSSLFLTQSTIDDAGNAGLGGLYMGTIDSTLAAVVVFIDSSTLTGNQPIFAFSGTTGDIAVSNTIATSVDSVTQAVSHALGGSHFRLSYDIISNASTSQYTVGAGNQFGVTDPKLATLANNGGPTMTRMPTLDSPALEAADPAITGGVDQRISFLRVVGGAADIGAVELQTDHFADAPSSSTFWANIQWMSESGLSQGTPQPSGLPLYKPVSAVSRQAMAAFLYRLSGETFSAPVDPTFADVDASNPFFTAIEWMAARGISTGTANLPGKPLYKPSDPVSRQAMAVFLARYSNADLSAPVTTQTFADVPITASTAAAIQWMSDNGISTGTPQPSGLPLYKPLDPVSRQAMAAFLFRVAHKY